MSMSSAAEKLADAVIETYFQLLDDPLPEKMRFLFAWLGATTLFGSTFVIRSGPAIFIDNPRWWVVIPAVVVAPLIFGFIIASAKTRHGPVRLYLSGLLLSGFVVGVARMVWSS